MGNCMTARAIKMPLTPEDFFHLNKFTYFTDHFREKNIVIEKILAVLKAFLKTCNFHVHDHAKRDLGRDNS